MNSSVFVFQNGAVDSNSVTEHASGTNVDFFTVPASSLTSISALENKVVLYFRSSNNFENSKANQAQVTLSTSTGAEALATIAIWTLVMAPDDPVLGSRFHIFDDTKSSYAVSGVLGVDSIVRPTAERFSSGGTGTSESAERIELEVRFDEAVVKGDPLYITGYNNGQNRITVAKADASDSAKMPSIGLAFDAYSQNDNGQAITIGSLEDIDTQVTYDFQEGDVIYVANGGGLTNTKPTGTNLIQNVGKVGRRQQNNGEIVVMAIGRSNDVPNLTTGKFFIGSASNSVESAYTLPTADGTANQVLQTNGSGAVSFSSITQATGNELENIVEDTTPQLGGNLDTNGNNINFGDTDEAVFGDDSDLRIYHSGGGINHIYGLSGSSTYITGGTDLYLRGVNGEEAVTINGNGSVEIFHDASKKMETTSTGVDVTGTLGLTNTTTGDSLLITTTEDSSDAAPVITLKRNSASPADGDYLGQLKFKGENDADQEVVYAKITGKISDVTDTTEDGLIEFALRKAGSNNIGARLTSNKFRLINGTGLEVGGYDFPTADGSANQVLGTDGAGTLSFVTRATEAYVDTAANTLTENTQTGTTYTTVLTDAGKMITCNNASAITVTIPPNSSVAYEAGTVLSFIQKGAGQVTLSAGVGVTLNNANGLKTASQYSVISCWKEDTDTWIVYGDTTS